MKLNELESEKLKEVINTALISMPILCPVIENALRNNDNQYEFLIKCAGDLAEISGAIDGILETFLIEGS